MNIETHEEINKARLSIMVRTINYLSNRFDISLLIVCGKESMKDIIPSIEVFFRSLKYSLVAKIAVNMY